MTLTLNPKMALAAGLMALLTLVHVFMGGPEINAPVRASALDEVVRSVSTVAWHAVTVLLTVFALGLAWVSRHANRPMEIMMIAIQLGLAGLFLVVGIADLGSVWPMPQWIGFLLIPALMVWAKT